MSTTSAARAPTPPINGTGSRNPNIARLGIVCTMLATAISGEARRGRLAEKVPSGTPSATATNVEPATSSTCCPTRLASSTRCAIQKAISDLMSGRHSGVVRTFRSAVIGRPEGLHYIGRAWHDGYGIEETADARIGGRGNRSTAVVGDQPTVIE